MKSFELSAPLTITLTPVEVQVILIGLKKLPYENVAPLIEKIVDACKPPEVPA